MRQRHFNQSLNQVIQWRIRLRHRQHSKQLRPEVHTKGSNTNRRERIQYQQRLF